MPRQIIIAEQHRIAAVFWEDQIQELVVATGNHQVGDIYLGSVENVLPGIDAAFVNIGDSSRNGFIHVSDLGPLRLKRTAGAITELLAPQQKVLVQVMKEPTGNKGPRLTGNITLPGRYLVLMPFDRGVKLSQRIDSQNERNRLRALAVLVKPAGMGLLVRTEAQGKAEEAIIEDLESLQKQWEIIQQEANSTRAPSLLDRDDDFIQRVLRDMYTADVNRIVVDSPTGVKRVKQYLLNWSSGRTPEGVLIDQYRGSESPTREGKMSILEYFRVNAAIREALKPRVDLPSGGYIIIEPTEALTVVDVNSGSFTRSATARETVLWTNCEAASEIARQIKLRNLAGVIIVDFIDMDARKDQLQVLEHFHKQLRSDKAKPQIAQLSELGLVELTRKRQGQNIYELFGRSCPTCGGLGHVVHLPGELEPIAPEAFDPIIAPPIKEVKPFRENTISLPPLDRVEPSEGSWIEEEEPLGLMHHPSYQERGINQKNRRRQRGVREEANKISRLAVRTVNHSYRNNSDEADESPVIPEIPPEIEVREKPSRSKPTRIESEPQETVSLEMSALEQEVYAWMGISPLIRLDKPYKNPKSVIVNLVGAGELPPEISVSHIEPVVTTEQVREIEPAEPIDITLPTIAETEPLEPMLVTPQVASNAIAEPVMTGINLEENMTASADKRRRRRRSSANGSELGFDPEM
ncbi:Rne/Rng family ribonuclease [Merismopedia glauca]|uniref:Ribonuclease E/G n=1 Tax=Merismopedia glauca CCAP 1448/3 TaxID=1296344 RepID=A0A2T1C9T2_9CYAN|nr:Rne/Rng family ribonuclease [Merismopedia glauca]PSB05001.1 ribonuclease E/G [Merismopedia glauca CCAP 1448/3]